MHLIRVDHNRDLASQLQPAVEVLQSGGVVIFPTDTVYGIGCDALHTAAVEKVFQIKGREAGKPLPVLVASVGDLPRLVRTVPPVARKLMEKFLPGGVTVVLPKRASVPDIVTAGTETIGVRIPDHPVTLALLRLSGVALTAPSANFSGEPPPRRVADMPMSLLEQVDVVIDDGDAPGGVPSTVVDMTSSPPRILRAGWRAVEIEAWLSALPTDSLDD
ncbi:MAG: L-threonylcarbamoyladenylate synthase, partial [Abditibacteriales bacterium]|nr:L-threonylcarbamoyladenylate synthase [Abditibacteriales bacterium]MDW8365825.1 L-threonylcarbamoyladenylate synthase [Abditibacteriales bacterium]